jgi:hypothetical protein
MPVWLSENDPIAASLRVATLLFDFIAPQQNGGVTAFCGLLESDRRFA